MRRQSCALSKALFLFGFGYDKSGTTQDTVRNLDTSTQRKEKKCIQSLVSFSPHLLNQETDAKIKYLPDVHSQKPYS